MTVLEGTEETVLVQIIAEETEKQREQIEAEFGQQMAEAELQFSWDQLLVFGDCAARCASRAGMEVGDLLRFATEQMNARHPWGLVVFRACLGMVARGEKGIRVGEIWIELERRKKTKASAAGKKSGAQRRLKARVPTKEKLVAEAAALKAGGMAQRDVAARLASRHNVTPDAIRKALKRD